MLSELAGAPRNIGLLVVPSARGHGLGTELGRAAASYAVRRHGYARWRCRDNNVRRRGPRSGSGFEPYATQLAIRPREWIVTGLNDGRVASNAAMSSSWPRVMPMSSSPSSSRHRV